MLKRIVAGVDGGPAGRDAAVLASALAAQPDCELMLAGVWPDVPLPIPVLLGDTEPREQVERMLLGVRERFAPQGVTKVLSDRSVARALRRLGEEEPVDLVVLGSSGHATRGHARAGRDARQVLHDAAFPVALAARGLHRQGFELRRVVVGVDGGDEAAVALDQAIAVASAHGAHLTAAVVVDDALPPVSSPIADGLDLLQWEEMVAHQRRRAERVIEAMVAHEQVDTAQMRVGDPAAELAAAAADADLLVVGSRHWGPLSRLVLGSVAEDLVRDAPCSLLLVPRPASEAEG